MKILEIIFPSILALLWSGTFQEIQGLPEGTFENEIWQLQNDNKFGDFNYTSTHAWRSLCARLYQRIYNEIIPLNVAVNEPQLVERTFVFKKTRRGDSKYINVFPFLECHLLDTLDPFWLLSREPNYFYICVEDDDKNPVDIDSQALYVRYKDEIPIPELNELLMN